MDVRQTCHAEPKFHMGRVVISPDGSKIAIDDVVARTVNVYCTSSFALLAKINTAFERGLRAFTKNGRYLIYLFYSISRVEYFAVDTGEGVVRNITFTRIQDLYPIENDDDDGGTGCVVFSDRGIFVCTATTDWISVFATKDANARVTGVAAKNTIVAYVDDIDIPNTFFPVYVWTAVDGAWILTRSFMPTLDVINHVTDIDIAGSWLVLRGNRTVCWSLTSEKQAPRVLSHDLRENKRASYLLGEVVYLKTFNNGRFHLTTRDFIRGNVIYRGSTPDPCAHASTFTKIIVSDNGRTLCGVSSNAVTLFDITRRDWSMRTHGDYGKSIRKHIECLLFLNMRPELKPSVIGMLPFELYVLLCVYVAVS